MNKVLILDFGSQYTQLIARRIRERHVYCEIHPCFIPLKKIESLDPQAIILSGGPASVLSRKAPRFDPTVFGSGRPILGICYGMQLIAHHLGGRVVPAKSREYGKARLSFNGHHEPLFENLPPSSQVWMSHGDSIEKVPPGFDILGRTENGTIAAIADPQRRIYALQFHPEVVHTLYGREILDNYLFKIGGLKADWTMGSFIHQSIKEIRKRVLHHQVVLGLSGGVDSTVAAFLIHKAIGSRLNCIFIDNGLLRKGEMDRLNHLFHGSYHIPIKKVNATNLFLRALKGVVGPEEKRKIIGRVFIRVFESEAKKIKGVKYLAQGTLYPDVIESVSYKGPSAVIKTHHNVGGLPKKMGLALLEPFRELFKDEVRELGRELGLPEEILNRHPFPGPGLAVRILGCVTRSRLDILRQADSVVEEEIKKSGLYDKLWQAFAVLLPVRSVGVMGDERTYENVCALRSVTSRDGMTADWAELPYELLGRISNRIINEVVGINRVVYDISSKPPATIEWE